MARPKRETTSAGDAAGLGHNSVPGLTTDQRHCLMLQHRRRYRILDAEKKRIAADLKNLGKAVKADLGEYGLDQIKDVIRRETPEGREASDAKIAALRESASWAIGHDGQFEMFADRKPSGDTQAFLDGKVAGMDDEPCTSPYGPGTADGEDWVRGWHAGRKVMDEILAMRATAEVIKSDADDQGDLDDGEGA